MRSSMGQSPDAPDISGSEDAVDSPSLQTTREDKEQWRGWCEIESEPAFFNIMLKQLGVQGLRVIEVFSLDKRLIQSLPQPAFGLIFLSRWQDNTAHEQQEAPAASQDVWFANQTVDNACATLALLNIVNNIEAIELGEHLTHFKNFTNSFSPELRGEAFGNFDFVRQVHNSFARKMDMLNIDLCMSHEANSRVKKGATRSRHCRAYEDPSYHFNAFILKNGEVWKLDGLERYPQSLGTCSESTWLEKVQVDLKARMMTHETNAVEFALLGVVQDPLTTLTADLATNIYELRNVEALLDQKYSTWRQSSTGIAQQEPDQQTLLGSSERWGITEEILAGSAAKTTACELAIGSIDDLVLRRTGIVNAQAKIRLRIGQEQDAVLNDESKCHERKCDYSSVIYDWLQFLVKDRAMGEVVGKA